MSTHPPSRQGLPDEGRRRVVIDAVLPSVDGGRFALKRVVGDVLTVQADAFPDGHDHITVRLRHRPPGSADWLELPMLGPDNDHWQAELSLPTLGRHLYTVVAWIDHFATWRHDLERRLEAATATQVDLAIGAGHVREAAARATGTDAARLLELASALDGPADEARQELALGEELRSLMERQPDRRFESTFEPVLSVTVDPPHARFSAWYELFPRSTSSQPGRHGTLDDVIARLPYVADLGFDVLYLPPIHPIGRTFRKGPNNTLVAGADDPGVPWAIGSHEGGHTDVHPELGSLDDLDRLVAACTRQGLRLALDLAFQASADHPWLEAHRDWFRARPDGTIQYAENPPKKYQDIYPFDFETHDWQALWIELRDVVRFWIDHGVRIFRVDNPHTKPFDFWEWLISDIKAGHPDVLFLSEAFTRPKVMYRLAKLGFSQSYTYFTWRNERAELQDYLEEITRPPVSDFFRANFFTNTPDILHAYLQTGGRPAFAARATLAATLTASYGIYGPSFELLEGVPREAGSEEYLDSEKYQVRDWALDDPASLAPLIRRLNAIRRAHPALQADDRLRFHASGDEAVIAYSKHTPGHDDVIVCVVNLDPTSARQARVQLPLAELGLDAAAWATRDLLRDGVTRRSGDVLELHLDPAEREGEGVAAVLQLLAGPDRGRMA